jgi:hypothetical protein
MSVALHSVVRLGVLLGVCISFGSTFAAAQSTSPDQVTEMQNGALLAKRACEQRIHFDTIKFEPCIADLVKKEKSSFSRLGILYSGYVSSIGFAHGGLPGARQTAWKMLQQFHPLQQKLGVNSETLCGILPGNCKNRIMGIDRMLKEGPPKPAQIPNNHH